MAIYRLNKDGKFTKKDAQEWLDKQVEHDHKWKELKKKISPYTWLDRLADWLVKK